MSVMEHRRCRDHLPTCPSPRNQPNIMPIRMKKGLLLAGLLTSTLCMAQGEATPYIPGINAEGVTYFLPQTVIDITIEAERVSYTPGEFCAYADKYLRIANVSDKADTHWEIKELTVRPTGVRDPEKGYTVKLRDKSNAALMELDPEGILLSINQQLQEPVALVPEKEPVKAPPTSAATVLTEETLAATSTAKMAELAAKDIFNIRESRNAIVRGQADNMPKDGEAPKIMLGNLDKQEAALLAMFQGTTTRETRIISVRITPGAEDVKESVLFRFSAKRGLLDADDLGGAPIYYQLTNQTVLPEVDEKTLKKAKKPRGIIYNMPGKALLKLYDSREVFYEEELPVAQYGQTEVLSEDLFGKGTTTRVTFDQATGAIRKIDR